VLLASARRFSATSARRTPPPSPWPMRPTRRRFSPPAPLNGDGIVPPDATDDAEAQALIKDIIACLGGSKDRTGTIGVTAAQWWRPSLANSAPTLPGSGRAGPRTSPSSATPPTPPAARSGPCGPRWRITSPAAAWRPLTPGPSPPSTASETEYLTFAAKDLQLTAERWPDSRWPRIEASRALPLARGVNPAWAAALATLQSAVVTPVLGPGKTEITEAEWQPSTPNSPPTKPGSAARPGRVVEKLGVARARELVAGKGRTVLADLLARDQALEPEFKAISDVERLVRYHRDLRALLHNFVNFADFYSRDSRAVFQAGTLYLDSRSTELCIRVDGPNPLAAMSKAYIAYCTARAPAAPPMTIAACFTQGDSDYLFAGRNGVFYDRKGRDWDAVHRQHRRQPDQHPAGLLVALQEIRPHDRGAGRQARRRRRGRLQRPPRQSSPPAAAESRRQRRQGQAGRAEEETRCRHGRRDRRRVGAISGALATLGHARPAEAGGSFRSCWSA
jgi:hypothetical protein